MLIDASQLPEGEEIKADICIVGAGAAGITLARELGSGAFDVCLLESGGLDSDEKVQQLYQGTNVGLPYFDLDICRLRFLGGTTNHWAGYCWRFRPEDFEVRDWMPHSGWPIEHGDVARFDEKAHEILDISPVNFSLDYWLDRSGRPDFLFDDDTVNTEVVRFSPPTRFGHKYLSDLKNSDAIKVYMNANVVEIETDETARTVNRLALVCIDGKRLNVRARNFVLAAGGIENPRLLLASNGVEKAGLGNGHDQVGRYFMEHPNLWQAAEIALLREYSNIETYIPRFDVDGRYLTRSMGVLSPQARQRERLLGANFFLAPLHRSRGVDALKALVKSPANMDQNIVDIVRDLDSVVDSIYKTATNSAKGPFGAKGEVVALDVRMTLEQAPNPDSRVVLGDSRDELGLPRVKLDWRMTDIDRRTWRRALELLGLSVGRHGLGRLKINSDTEEDWPANMEGNNHHIGTTRMSATPETGVVDKNCRVHGMANLYVAGSSVFSTSGINPPTYTIVALALRLAEHLKNRVE